MSEGLLELIGSVATLVFVIPIALAGIELLSNGRTPIGVGLLAVALLMLVVDRYVTTPGDIPTKLASKLAGVVVEPPEED